MSKYPLQPTPRRPGVRPASPRDVSHDVVDVESREVVPAASREVAPLDTPATFGGFFSFQYTRTEITSAGSRTHVRARTTRLHEGRLTSESFEGELDGRAHADAIRAAEREVLEQAARLLNPLSWLLPWPRGGRSGR